MPSRLIPSPVGELFAQSNGTALTGMEFARGDQPDNLPDAVLDLTEVELASYFSGALTRFTVPLAYTGNEFETSVWDLLRQIPFGVMWSYGEMAHRLGDPGAARAVGRANNQNPITIIVPCHRVVGADGTLVGYGGGMERKKFLLNHEAAVLGASTEAPALKSGQDQGSFF